MLLSSSFFVLEFEKVNKNCVIIISCKQCFSSYRFFLIIIVI